MIPTTHKRRELSIRIFLGGFRVVFNGFSCFITKSEAAQTHHSTQGFVFPTVREISAASEAVKPKAQQLKLIQKTFRNSNSEVGENKKNKEAVCFEHSDIKFQFKGNSGISATISDLSAQWFMKTT